MDNIELPGGDEGRKDRFINIVALTVAIISCFMAVAKIKDDNIVQAMQKAQADSVDYWNEYQARRQRQFGVELAIAQLKATEPDSPERAKTIEEWQKTADNFKNRAEESSTKAKNSDSDYQAGNTRDDLFDLSDAFLSVGLALLAITALTRLKWLLGLSIGFATVGIIFGVGGFNNWIKLHDSVSVLIDFLT